MHHKKLSSNLHTKKYKFNQKNFKNFMKKRFLSLPSLKKKDDSAQENLTTETETVLKENHRNELFDRLAYNQITCYAALRKDFVKENYFRYNLFCGQVGEIQNVISKKNKDSYLVTFTDYKNNENEYADCLIKKKDLLPLFYFSPAIYQTSQTKPNPESDQIELDILTIQQIRNKWEEHDFSINLNNTKLRRHNKLKTRFNHGQLVTVVFDFKTDTETGENESFIIQAGQVGIISNDKNKNNNFIEVTFWSIPFGLLATNGEDFVSSPPEENPLIYATDSWEKKISIDKYFLFPLYCEKLI